MQKYRSCVLVTSLGLTSRCLSQRKPQEFSVLTSTTIGWRRNRLAP